MNQSSKTAEGASGSRTGGTRIQSVARAGRLLLWLARQPQGATAKDIAAAQELALPTTYHLLNTLVDEGLLTQDAQRRYGLGSGIAILAQAYMRGTSVPDELLGALRELARRTGETAYLADWGEEEIRVLASVEGDQMVRVAEVSSGPYDHGHARANGKVLLAFAADDVRNAYLRRHPLVPVTPNTIVEPGRFERELNQIRERGYAYDEEEYAQGLCCVAAPVLRDAEIIAAMGLAVPATRFNERRAELTATLLDAVSGLQATGQPAVAS